MLTTPSGKNSVYKIIMHKVACTCRKPELTRSTCLFLMAFALLIFQPVLSGREKEKKSGTKKTAEPASVTKVSPAVDAARALVLTGNFDKAVTGYALALKKDSNNMIVSAEYAYTLALNGIYDAALARLDNIRSRNFSSPETDFYISQVFALMGYDQLAAEFGKKVPSGKIPSWISAKAPEYLLKYGYNSSPSERDNEEDVTGRFKRANRMAAMNNNLQSIALFEGITGQYPGEFLPYVGYSIALEKASMYERSAQTIEKALSIAGNSPQNEETRRILNQRLETIRKRSASENMGSGTAVKKQPGTSGEMPGFTAYAGGTASDSYINISARIGTYKTGAGSTSFDLGFSSISGNTSLNVGLMSFFRQKIFVGGYGLNGSFGGGSKTLYFKLSVGISLMNKKRSSSFDIFLDGMQPLVPKGAATTMGLSVGRSVYFGKR